MTDAILVALITGGLSLLGVIFTNVTSNTKTESQIRVAQAVTDTKIDALTREVREHNDFAKRIPVVEQSVKALAERVHTLETKG